MNKQTKRGRKPDPIKSERIRIEGNRKRGISARDDKTFAWLDGIDERGGDRFGSVWELLTAALNGELGPAIQQAVEEGDADKAREAAKQIFASFVVDEEE